MPHRIFAFLGALFLLASTGFAAKDRIAARPDSGRLATLRNTVHPQAEAQLDRGAVDPLMRIGYATLLLKPTAGLEGFLAAQQDPNSPDYHRWLTPEQFGDRFGLSANDIGKIVSWLKDQGFTIHDVARGRHWVSFSGTVSQVSQAFHSEIHRFLVGGVTHFANAAPLSIPVEFDGVINNVAGLNDFQPQPQYRLKNTSDFNSGSSHFLAPDDLATVYNISPLYQAGIDGTGQKIAIIGRTNIDLADIRSFRKTFGLPPNDPQVVLFGTDPGTNAKDQVEADLDLELTGGIARNATLIYVNSTDTRISAQYAVDQNLAPVMTFSFGSCEQQTLEILRSIAQQANAQGITWMASSGDLGAATCDYNAATPQGSKGLAASYPASIPEITAVGGTTFNEGSGTYWAGANGTALGSALSYIPEVVWNDSAVLNGIIGGGGGASRFFPKPWWQTGPGVPGDGARDLPDVAFTSSGNHDAYMIVSGGVLRLVGGTSAASPVFAGIVALLNQSLLAAGKQTRPGLGNINPALYRLAGQSGIFHDITGGDNKVLCQQGSPDCINGTMGYDATPGYDLASGLGSVDASRLISGWNPGISSTTTITASPQSPAPGDQATLNVTVRGDGGTPSGTVTFLGDDINIGTVTLNAGAASLIVSGLQLAGGDGSVFALYSGDARFAASSVSTKVSFNVLATASFIVPSVFPNPVHELAGVWPYTITLTQKSDVPTTITAFTIDGVNNLPAFSTVSFKGAFSVSLTLAGRLAVPATRNFHFAGTDAGGAQWTSDLAVPFLSPAGPLIIPGLVLTGSPSVIQQNPSADPSCQWTTQLSVQETGGYTVNLSRFTIGSTTISGNISQYFGSTRLAPYGRLTGTVCLSDIVPPAQKTITIAGSAEGSTVTATLNASFTGPSASSTSMSAPSPVVLMTGSNSNVALNFGAGSPAWTATVLASGYSNWLTVSPASGMGAATLSLQANGAGLSNGVYNAVLSIQSTDTLPQSLQIPIAFVVGSTPGTSIMGVNSAASAAQGFAPGMWMAVYGKNLAPSPNLANIVPLNLSLAGVSATVNGIAAPLWFVSSGQMNIQIPYETSAGPAILGINNNGATAAFAFPVSPTAPGIFNTSLTGKPGQTIVAYISGEGDVTPTLATGNIPPLGTKLANFPQPRQPISITVAGEPASIAFAGIVSLVGVTQVNFTIPSGVQPGAQPVVVTVGGVASGPLNMTVTAP